jgi:hypothetical protein
MRPNVCLATLNCERWSFESNVSVPNDSLIGQASSVLAQIGSSTAETVSTDSYLVVALAVGGIALLLVGRALTAIFAEYIKLWYFKGVPPWRARNAQCDALEQLKHSLEAERVEFEATKGTVDRALARAEHIEALCRSLIAQRNSMLKASRVRLVAVISQYGRNEKGTVR